MRVPCCAIRGHRYGRHRPGRRGVSEGGSDRNGAARGHARGTFTTLPARQGVKRVMSLVDREAGASLDLVFTATAEDAQRVHEALDSLTPPEGAGKRTSRAELRASPGRGSRLAPRARVTARTRIRNVLVAVTPRRYLASRVTTRPPGASECPSPAERRSEANATREAAVADAPYERTDATGCDELGSRGDRRVPQALADPECEVSARHSLRIPPDRARLGVPRLDGEAVRARSTRDPRDRPVGTDPHARRRASPRELPRRRRRNHLARVASL